MKGDGGGSRGWPAKVCYPAKETPTTEGRTVQAAGSQVGVLHTPRTHCQSADFTYPTVLHVSAHKLPDAAGSAHESAVAYAKVGKERDCPPPQSNERARTVWMKVMPKRMLAHLSSVGVRNGATITLRDILSIRKHFSSLLVNA
jgi:hypothetical protein